KWFAVDYSLNGTDKAQVVVDRSAFESRVNNLTTANYSITDTRKERFTNIPTVGNDPRPEQAVLPPNYAYTDVSGQPVYEAEKDLYNGDFSLAYQQVFGGLDGLLFQFYLAYTAQLNLTESTYQTGRLGYRIFDNYDKFDEESSSALPPVRTNQKDYLTGEELTLRYLSLVHAGQLDTSPHYYAAYAGYFESMFGGVGAEYLYRPFDSPLALGVDINRVKQREFDQRFSFQDYSVTTGHVTTYWDTGFQDLVAKVSAGQYLAGDVGATFDLSRQFNNGTVMGAFFTKTNVSAAEFGEGSFDKGIYLKIPWESFMPSTVSGAVNLVYRPLTRDGGAMVVRPVSLFNQTEASSSRFFEKRPARLSK
ncbi:MAG: YjbH domain-containing protein, partial [Limnobacter sp.]|nr:YjbH domain-containing protein [Limnobacter sp.]